MENRETVIRELSARLDQLTRQQQVFQEEINKIRRDIYRLSAPANSTHEIPRPHSRQVTPAAASAPEPENQYSPVENRSNARTPWEEFIGTNLLNKAGIAVLVLGIGFGAKYSIDRGLIDAMTRVILGYASGLILLAIAFRLREKHKAFSAVLLSGGMAVMYFITYLGYSFYDGMIPQVPAFMMMVLLTMFTVLAAVRYNYEMIGVIGLAGAYAVPLLLGNGSGKVVILFSYISIINTGILFLAFNRYWKRLYYCAFVLSWLTFASWYAFSFDRNEHVLVALIFSTIFFITFYATFLAYKLLRKESLDRADIVCMLLNSFLYYGYGYLTIDSLNNGEQFLGLFTVLTAVIHFIAGLLVYKTHARFSDMFYFVAGMVLVFITIAVPVQLEGNWVTLVWAAEATLLFWIGRTKSFTTYEKLSYPMMVLAFLSLLHDWSIAYPDSYMYAYQETGDYRIFVNIRFLTSVLVAVSFLSVLWTREKYRRPEPFSENSPWSMLVALALPVLTAFIFYVAGFKEIEAYWNTEYASSKIVVQAAGQTEYNRYNDNLLDFRSIWLIMYSAAFAIALSLLQWKWRTKMSVLTCLAINTLVLLAFLTAGLAELASLRSGFLGQDFDNDYAKGYGYILIRYAAVLFVFPLVLLNRRLVQLASLGRGAQNAENLLFHFFLLVLLSSELIHWLDMARMENSFRLSLTILWGTYALLLIVIGLSKEVKHIRIAAIALFAITLLKLFAYDMEDMSTILKTVVMIVLGALLLMASFIYNKYKRSSENEAQ